MKNSLSSIFNNKKTGIIMSVVSLMLIISLLVVATYSWVEAGNEGEVDSSNNLSFDVSPDLDISGNNVNDGKIEIKDFVLREVSSVDGRDVYVPDDSFYEKTPGDGTKTDELRFREANPADVYDGKKGTSPPANMRYVSFTFTMSSEVTTPVYLSDESHIWGTGCDFIRVAIDSHEDENPPKVISNASDGYEVTCSPVSAISDNGEAESTEEQTADALIRYMGLNTEELFTLEAGQKKQVTVTVWLEGTIGNFSDDIVGKNDLDIRLKFLSSKVNFNTIKAVDRTYGNWVHNEINNKPTYLFVFNANNPKMYYRMIYNSEQQYWSANVPQSITKIYLQRYNPDDKSIKYNMWGSGNYPLTIPGAKALLTNGTESDKETGITRIYNILGTDEIEGIDSYDDYEAGIWGDLPDSAFDEVHFFDQSSSSSSDTKGYFNWDASTIPLVDMEVGYNYGGVDITSKIRYRLFREYVGTRLFHNTQFVGAEGYTINSVEYVDYKYFNYQLADANDEAGAIKDVKIGSMAINATSGYCSDNKRFFAYTGNSTGYWGTCMNYLSNHATGSDGIYSNDSTANGGVRYAICYNFSVDSTDKYKITSGTWKSMCRWSDVYTKFCTSDNDEENKTYFPGKGVNDEWVYACVNPGYDTAIFCRMDGSAPDNKADNLWNRSGENISAQTTCDCSITDFNGRYFNHKAFSNWPKMPGRDS